VIARLVVVAEVVVAFWPVKFCSVVEEVTKRVELMVEEAVERKPFWKERVVEVEFSPVAKVLYGKAKVMEER